MSQVHIQRTVEFYVLWNDRTWTSQIYTLAGGEACLGDDDCVQLAARYLTDQLDSDPSFEALGPLYHLGNTEEVETDES